MRPATLTACRCNNLANILVGGTHLLGQTRAARKASCSLARLSLSFVDSAKDFVVRGSQTAGLMPCSVNLCRDVTALAEAELQRKLSASLADLRKGLSSARGLHASLRAEAAALESFIPVIVEGAKSGMQQALAKQVGSPLRLGTPPGMPREAP